MTVPPSSSKHNFTQLFPVYQGHLNSYKLIAHVMYETHDLERKINNIA